MLQTKSRGRQPSGSGEEVFKGFFTTYGRGGHLGHMTRTIWTNFRSPTLRSLHMKFEFNWPSGFRGEDVWKCWRTDGRRSDWYTSSSPMSLWLRWANNWNFTLKIFCLSSPMMLVFSQDNFWLLPIWCNVLLLQCCYSGKFTFSKQSFNESLDFCNRS